MDERYSVLMSVYEKERPEYLQAALKSMMEQTVPPDEIVLVCDGALTAELEDVIRIFEDELTLVKLSQNVGLGKALNEGLKHCSNEWIARMDSDDLSVPDRCERQLKYIAQHPETDILSGSVAEFSGDALTVKEAPTGILLYKKVPASQQEIERYIKYRNPINHPCVFFRKSKVRESGGYQPCPFFEDYDLWARMYLNHCNFANLMEPILYMRVNAMHKRRGGVIYARAIIHFWTRMYHRRIIGFLQYLVTVISRVTVSLLPNWIRKMIYDKKLRN